MSEVKWAIRNSGSIDIQNDVGSGYSHFQLLTPNINQGPSQFDRIGSDVRFKYFKLHLSLVFAPQSIITQTFFRIAILKPLKIPNDTSDVSFVAWCMDQSGGPGSYLATFNNKNVQVLYDRTFVMGTADTWSSSGRPALRAFKIGRRFYSKVSYDRNANIPSDPKDNLYMLMLWPPAPGGSQTQWFAQYHFMSRMSFRDL